MICRKCETLINSGTKCFQCGLDNNAAPTTATPAKKHKGNPVLISVMALFIVIGIVTILSMAGVILSIAPLAMMKITLFQLLGMLINTFFISIPGVNVSILAVITIAVAVLDIALCIFIIKLKKQAFKAYVGLTVVTIIIRAFTYLFIIPFVPAVFLGIMKPFLVKGVLLFVVYIVDGKRVWEGISFNEPVSVIRARQRQEREVRDIADE